MLCGISFASFKDFNPKNNKLATAMYSPMGIVFEKLAGTAENTLPMTTEITDINPNADVAPIITGMRPILIASKAAMKNVLSPNSDMKISANAAVNPVFATACTTNCTAT